MLEQSNELAAWDRDHFFHPSTHMGTHARGETPNRIMASGEGVYITDTSGRTSLDALASTKAKLGKEIEAKDADIGFLEKSNEELEKKLKDAQEKLAKFEPKSTALAGGAKPSPYTIWYWVGGAVLAAAVLVGSVLWIGGQMSGERERQEEAEEPRNEEPKNQGE